MKIAHINPGERGLASYALNICNHFNRRNDENVENLIISAQKWKKQRVDTIYEPKSVLLGRVLPWVIDKKGVYRKLADFKPDVLHHHHPSGNLDRHVDSLKKALGVPLVTTIHMSVGSKKYFIDKVMHYTYRFCRKRFKTSDAVVAISKFVRRQIEALGGFSPEKIVLLYAGVNTDVFVPVEHEKHDTLEVTFVGQIMPEKGIDILVDVVMRLAKERKVRLNIVGEGNYESILKRKTAGHPEINWVGFLGSQKEVANYYATSDVVVLPTRWDEAFSYIPLEAFSSGTALIASKTGGNREIVDEHENGFLFPRGNRQELYQILKNVEIEKLWEMGLKGREKIMKNHTLESFGEKYYALYQNLINDPSNIKPID